MSDVKEFATSKTVAVDFDGVLAAWVPSIESFGAILPGAKEALDELRALDCRLILHTARPSADEPIRRLCDYLRQHDIVFDEINTNSHCPWVSAKPLADLYIDDLALRFEGDWMETLAQAKRHLGLVSKPNPCADYRRLLRLVTTRAEQLKPFTAFLSAETSWLTAPASTRFHLAKEGGLLEHSVNVAQTLLTLRRALAPELSVESCVIVGLFHDLGKVGMPGRAYYLPNPDAWQVRHRGRAYIINEEIVHMDIATRSLFLLASHLSLSDEEAQAIRFHDGQYIEENHSVAHRECQLTRLLQYADNWSGGVLEK